MKFLVVLCGSILGLAALSASSRADADELSDIQGAWAIQDYNCADVFKSDQGKISLLKRQDDDLPGFIVDGKRIDGIGSSCDIASTKKVGDTIKALLSCKSQIMFGTMSVSVKMPDPNTLIRLDPDFSEISTTYHKCMM